MNTANRVQIQNETICKLHSTNTLRRCVNPTILSPAIVILEGRRSSLTLECNPSRRRKTLNSNLLNSTKIVLYSARTEGLGKCMYIFTNLSTHAGCGTRSIFDRFKFSFHCHCVCYFIIRSSEDDSSWDQKYLRKIRRFLEFISFRSQTTHVKTWTDQR